MVMLKTVVLAQYVLLIQLWIITLFLIFVIFNSRSMSAFIKKSPELAIIFGLTSVIGIHQILQFSLWLLYFLNMTPNRALLGNFAVLWGVLSICYLCIYDLFTIVLFIRRIIIILDPLRDRRWLNHAIYGLASSIGIAILVYLVVAYLKVIDFERIPTANECFSLVCTQPLMEVRDAINAKTVLSIANVLVGSVFLVMFLIRTSKQTTNVKKVP
uniref:G_PROTEIN_RECEP_F1_2 domain-containing protein n=1 Tax=Steinernema glaseri TaxID=37863 RepID=A0A1I7Y5B0_9BILA